MVLACYSLSPVIAGLGLYYVQILLPDLVLLSHFSVSIFFFTAFLKPFMYLTGILTDNVRNKLVGRKINANRPYIGFMWGLLVACITCQPLDH
jgi:hypothetical protein